MELYKRDEERMFLYKKKGDVITRGIQYNKNKTDFINVTYSMLFNVLLSEYTKKHEECVKEIEIDGGKIVYLEIDYMWNIDFIQYVQMELDKFLLSRVIENNTKIK